MRGTPGQIRIRGDEIGGDGDNLNKLIVVTDVFFSSVATTASLIKTRTLEVRDGIVTLIGAESSWTAAVTT